MTESGRYLSVYFIYKKDKKALLVTARDMTEKEKEKVCKKVRKKTEPIPAEFETLIEASDFWDAHDVSEYWDKTKEARFKVSLKKEPKYIALENELARKVFNIAKKKHISTETLVNLWLKEKLSPVK